MQQDRQDEGSRWNGQWAKSQRRRRRRSAEQTDVTRISRAGPGHDDVNFIWGWGGLRKTTVKSQESGDQGLRWEQQLLAAIVLISVLKHISD